MKKSETSKAIEHVKKSLSPQVNDMMVVSSMSSLIIAVCIIDTLAGFNSGYEGQGTKHKSRFNKFVLEYLPEYSDTIYDVRNGLIHGFSNNSNLLFSDSVEFNEAYPSLKTLLGEELLNVPKFKSKIVEIFELFFEEVGDLDNSSLRSNFLKRYKSLGIISDYTVPLMNNLKGEITTNFDNMDRMPGTNIPIGIANPIKIKR